MLSFWNTTRILSDNRTFLNFQAQMKCESATKNML